MTNFLKRPQMRMLLRRLFPLEADLTAFCTDYFPSISQRFSGGMGTVDRLSLLLEGVELTDLRAALLNLFSPAFLQQEMEQISKGNVNHAPLWNLPPQRNPDFTGRTTVLAEVRAQLGGHGGVALCGLGGIGKTQVAIQYAHLHKTEYGTIFMLPAEGAEALRHGYLELGQKLHEADRLGQPFNAVERPDAAVQAVLDWMSHTTDWLIIFDNADRPELLRAMWPRKLAGHVLLTTRSRGGRAFGLATLRLTEFTEAEALEFLGRRHVAIVQPAEVAAATALTRELVCLPLALEQAAAYVAEHDLSWQRYWESFQRRPLALLEEGRPLPADYERSIATTWQMNFDAIAAKSAAAADLLRTCAFLHADHVPEELFLQGGGALGPELKAQTMRTAPEEPGNPAEPERMDRLLAPLLSYSLIRRDSANARFSIHRLVQAVLWHSLSKSERLLWVERIVNALTQALPATTQSPRRALERMLPHLRATYLHIKTLRFNTAASAELLHRTADCLDEQGQHQEAERFLLRAILIRKKLNKQADLAADKSLELAKSLNNLAVLYFKQGRLVWAERLYYQVLWLRESVLGPASPTVARSLNNLAMLYLKQCKLEKVVSLLGQVKGILEQASEPNPRDWVAYLNTRARYERACGQVVEAEASYRRALKLCNDNSPASQSQMTILSNNLGELYRLEGRYADADALYMEALSRREQLLGHEHHHLANVLENLAESYRAQRRNTEHEQFSQRASAIKAGNIDSKESRTKSLKKRSI